jgi:hypothetical protein
MIENCLNTFYFIRVFLKKNYRNKIFKTFLQRDANFFYGLIKNIEKIMFFEIPKVFSFFKNGQK